MTENDKFWMNIHEFIELGLLEEINRQFLHPLGLALEASGMPGDWKLGILDFRHDPEGILFTTLDREKIAKAQAFIEQQHRRRLETCGFIIQEDDAK